MSEENQPSRNLAFWQGIILAVITSVTSVVITIITQNDASADTPNSTTEITDIENLRNPCPETANCDAEINARISGYELNLLDPKTFKSSFTKEESIQGIQSLVDTKDRFQSHQDHYLFKVYLLQRTLLDRPRHLINTRTSIEDLSYPIIQQVPKDLGWFDGAIDGTQESTRKALIRFQQYLNTIDPGYINPDNYGLFGSHALLAVQNQFKIQTAAK